MYDIFADLTIVLWELINHFYIMDFDTGASFSKPSQFYVCGHHIEKHFNYITHFNAMSKKLKKSKL